MYLQRLLQINMATLSALSALLLGMGRRSEALPLLVLTAALASIWLTDVTGWFRLGRTVGNLAALVAAGVISLVGLSYYGSVLDILNIVNLLVCLQIILLFEEKDDRVYWLLAGVSLLQVVAATAFSQGVWFGLLLVVYMLVGLSALALLMTYRQWSRHRPAAEPPPPSATAGRRWPLAGQQPTLASTPAGPGRAGIGRELFGRLGRIGLGTLALTVVLFFTLPRLGGTAWRGALPSPRHVVGFDDRVTLGELGETIESNDEVMRVSFRDDANNPYPVGGEIYLHGATLVDYARGQWRAEASTFQGVRPRLDSANSLPSAGLVRQECTIEPLDQDELFYVTPVIAIRPDGDVIVDRGRGRLLRAFYRRRRRFSYELGTTALVDGRQQPLVPNVQVATTGEQLPPPKNDAPKGLPNLTALADRWIAESGLPPEDRLGRARYLEQKLATSEQFQYSLQGQARDLSIDPIEDFVANNPRGHCEYFATALTLMLRSQGIPARMVVGYKCDEYNALGEFYQVRQSHAHTWVEAYLPGEDLPAELLHGEDYWDWQSAGGWLRLDPTPAAGAAEAGGPLAAIFARIKVGVDWLESLWADYVLEMDRRRQRDAIYRPVIRAVRDAVRKLRDPDWWRELLGKMGQALNIARPGAAGGYWLLLVLIVLAGLLVVVLVGWLLVRGLRRLWSRLAGRAAAMAGRDHPRVEFYARLEALLARHGLVRPPGQTQLEFAAAAGTRLAVATGQPRLAPLPGRVVEAFYHVRFGRLPLDRPQTQAVEHALEELAASL